VNSGILLLDKPLGISSNGALQRIKRALGAKKAGHVGSLDPLATGMLPICLDEATKVAGEIVAGRKQYHFTVRLGVRTATGDTEGAPVECLPVIPVNQDALERTLQHFVGPQDQIPPMYSALKVEGQPLYKLARAGLDHPRASRAIHIYDLHLLHRTESTLELAVLCSKGTYVRTLAEDISRALGTCGHVIALRRLYVEPFAEREMQSLESVMQLAAQGRQPLLLAPDAPLRHLSELHLELAASERLRHGQAVECDAAMVRGRVRLYGAAGEFLGLGETDGLGQVRPKRLLQPL
jgi:tRNA pseudouridine55 synthase